MLVFGEEEELMHAGSRVDLDIRRKRRNPSVVALNPEGNTNTEKTLTLSGQKK